MSVYLTDENCSDPDKWKVSLTEVDWTLIGAAAAGASSRTHPSHLTRPRDETIFPFYDGVHLELPSAVNAIPR